MKPAFGHQKTIPQSWGVGAEGSELRVGKGIKKMRKVGMVGSSRQRSMEQGQAPGHSQ